MPRNLFTKVMSEVHKEVSSEHVLMTFTGEQLLDSTNKSDDARADLSVRNFWQDRKRAFFDVKVFNPFIKTHHLNPISIGLFGALWYWGGGQCA